MTDLERTSAGGPGRVVNGSGPADRCWHRPNWTVAELEAAKRGRTISVVLPALNEAETVGSVVETITPMLGGLVDELIVLDSGSTDDRGARIGSGRAGGQPGTGAAGTSAPAGRGEVLWRSLAATTGDIVVFIDSDLIEPGPDVRAPAGRPDPDRRRCSPGSAVSTGGRQLRVGEDANGGVRSPNWSPGRCWPRCAPNSVACSSRWAESMRGTRELLTSIPFAPGYGVEIGILIDTYDKLGLSAIAQVNLGVRTHRNRPMRELGPMSRQVIATLLSRCGIGDSRVG